MKVTDVIDDFRGLYAFLSNFYPSALYGGKGLVYPTAEAAFQGGKTADLEQRRAIAAAKTPTEAKRLGQRVTLHPDWDAKRRFAVMQAVLRAKFTDPGLAAQLVATGNAELVEGNMWHDQFWGSCRCGRPACAGPGFNMLGRFLMELRSELACYG